MRRVAFITTSYPSDDDDAAGHFVRAEVHALSKQGDAVTVIAPAARRDPKTFDENILGIAHWGAFGTPGAVARMRYRPDRWLGATRFGTLARRALFERNDFDEVVAHFLLPGYWPIAVGHAAITRVVVHGSDLRLLERVPRLLRAHVLACLEKDKPVIQCVSYALAESLVGLSAGRLRGRIRVEASPIDLPALPDRAQLRCRLGLGDERLIVVVARLIESKRVDVALLAALKVPGARIVVCGDGPERGHLMHHFPTVEFLGHLSRHQTLSWIAAADVLLSASRDEGAPTVIREARALGVPVVSTSAGDLLDWAKTDPGLRVVP